MYFPPKLRRYIYNLLIICSASSCKINHHNYPVLLQGAIADEDQEVGTCCSSVFLLLLSSGATQVPVIIAMLCPMLVISPTMFLGRNSALHLHKGRSPAQNKTQSEKCKTSLAVCTHAWLITDGQYDCHGFKEVILVPKEAHELTT